MITEKNKDIILFFLLFLVNAIEMTYELVASRAISPYYGTSNYTMTAIIAVMLLSGSLGNVLGGKIAHLKDRHGIIAFLFIIISVLLFFIVLNVFSVVSLMETFSKDIRINILGTSLMFFAPAMIIGVFSPICMTDILQKRNKDKLGRTNGNIHAVMALGSLSGTVVGGFVLIPIMGTNMIFIVISAILLIIGICYAIYYVRYVSSQNKRLLYIVLALCFIVWVALIPGVRRTSVYQFQDNIFNEMNFDTPYGKVLVYDTKNEEGKDIRIYQQGDFFASATFLDEELKYECVYEYVNLYDYAHDYLDINNTLMIGGAAYQYPKYFISHFPDATMDVVEINGDCTDIAMKYFFLDDLFEEYGDERLSCIEADGRVFLNETDKQYDAIFNDAFSGGAPIPTLSTVEFAQILKSKLSPEGVYMSNVIGTLQGDASRFIRGEAKTLRQVFDNVYILPLDKDIPHSEFKNWMLVATDNDYIPDIAISIDFTEEDYLFTDDYCPVDVLAVYRLNN